MKLYNREEVVGTTPSIYIGHRGRPNRDQGSIIISPLWHAEYSLFNIKYHEGLRTTNKAEAIRKAKAITQRIALGETRNTHRPATWAELREGYIAYVESRRRAPKTIGKYKHVADKFIAFSNARHRLRPQQVGPVDFWAFNGQMAKDGLKGGTIEDSLIIIKQMFKWGATKAKPRLLLENSLADEEVAAAEDAPQPCFTPQQVAKLLAAADEHHRPIWAVMAYLGLRVGEVRELLWSDFSFDTGKFGWVHIQRGGSGSTTKGKWSRRIPLNKELASILAPLVRHDDGRLFHQQPSHKYPHGGRPLSSDKLLKSLKRLCKRCGFSNPNQYKLHTFRHAFASMLARSNVSYKQALDWMGHEDSEILALYIKLFDNDAEKAIELIKYTVDAQTLVSA